MKANSGRKPEFASAGSSFSGVLDGCLGLRNKSLHKNFAKH
jgi:hypothetical protein